MRLPQSAGCSSPTRRPCVCSFGLPAGPQARPVLFPWVRHSLASRIPQRETRGLFCLALVAWASWDLWVGRNSVPLFRRFRSGPRMCHLPARSLRVRPWPSQSPAPKRQAAGVRFSPEKGPRQGRGRGKHPCCPREVSPGVFPARGRPARGSKAAQTLPTPWP